VSEKHTRETVRELEKRVAGNPDSIVMRLKLAAAFRQIGRLADAMTIYRGLANHYRGEGRLVQALAVCRSILEIDPSDAETQQLYADIDAARTGAPLEEPTQLGDGHTTPAPQHQPAQRDEITTVRDDFTVTDPGLPGIRR
jgi:hypothetical protein